MFRSNWHSHTYRCKHAAGDVTDYCAEAMRAGITTLGISDHTPTMDGRWDSVRMDYAQMPDYIEAIRFAAAAYPGIRLYAGLECEWVPSFGLDWFEGDLRGRFGLDFIAYMKIRRREKLYGKLYYDLNPVAEMKQEERRRPGIYGLGGKNNA